MSKDGLLKVTGTRGWDASVWDANYQLWYNVMSSVDSAGGNGIELLNEIVTSAYVDVDNLTTLNRLFYGYVGDDPCFGSLQSVYLSNLDTSSVTDMSNMLTSCSSLTSLDLSNFDFSNVSNIDGMFSYCSNLKTIYVNSSGIDIFDGSHGEFTNCGTDHVTLKE